VTRLRAWTQQQTEGIIREPSQGSDMPRGAEGDGP
jgi:hypothetical protein